MKYSPIGCLAILALVVGALWFVFDSAQIPGVFNQTPPSVNQTGQLPQTSQSRYADYSKNLFEAAKGKKRILYFHADWCSTCRPLDRELQAMMDKIPQDVVIFKTNYDREISLKQIYAITYQHTFVQVDEQGNVVARWSGGNFNDVIGNIK